MSSVFQSFQKRSFIIPTTTNTKHAAAAASKDQDPAASGLLRRRLPSLSSLKIQSFPSSSSSVSDYSAWAAAAFRRSTSAVVPSSSSSLIREWWERGWDWILLRKPSFARDLEMNEQETALLGRHSKGSWRHVFLKLKTLLLQLHGTDTVGVLPTRTSHYN